MEWALGERGEELANRAGRWSVSAAARQLSEELKRTAPGGPVKPKVRTSKGGTVTRTDLGHLKDNIRTKREKARKSYTIRYVVHFGNAFWALFRERGTVRQPPRRSEEHTSELQSLMRISYAVFCLKKKTPQSTTTKHTHPHTYPLHAKKHFSTNR